MPRTKVDKLMLESTANGSDPPPSGFHEYGVESIHTALLAMLSHADAVHQATADEAVHQMRVASRRLRAAIAVFEPAFEGKRYRRFRIHVKELTDALSQARDLDVMLGAIKKLCGETPPPERIGIDHFRDHLAERRSRLQKRVRKSLTGLASADLEGEFAKIAGAPANQHDDLEAEFAESIQKRVSALLEWEPYIHDNRRVYELHQMRIAAKRLRYTMELFARYRGPLFTAAIDQVRKVQEHLGKIHDADVLAPALLVFLKTQLQPVEEQDVDGVYAVEAAQLAGLVAAAVAKRKEREEQYEKFLAQWDHIKTSALLEHILDMARSSPPAPTRTAGRRRRGHEQASVQ